jgi:molecular chaperone GrpE
VRQFDLERSEYTLSHSRDPEKPIEETENDPKARPEAAGAEGEASSRAEPCADEHGLRHEADKLARLEAEREEMRQLLIHRQADFENFRKRVERERREDRDRVVMHLAETLLPVLDNFERALSVHRDPAYEEYHRGFEMIYRQLTDLLAENGIRRMESPVGRPFDPHLHHAFDRAETSEHPEGTIIEELQSGYRFRDRVLRPAQVRVAVRPGGEKASSGSLLN